MSTTNSTAIRIPGAERLGRGINAFGDFNKPQSAGVICDTSAQDIEIEVSGKTYYRPRSVEFSFDPSSEEVAEAFTSREEYQSSVQDKLKVEAKYGVFAGSFEATFGSDYRSLSERAAAMLTFHSTLWTLQLKDRRPTAEFLADLNALPNQFTNQTVFYDFFRKYGVYVVTEVTVGGSLDYAMLVDRQQTTSKETLKAKVTAEYGVMFKGNASQSKKEEVNRFKEFRTSRLTTRGGDAAALQRVDTDNPSDNASAFNAWKATIPSAPGIVSMELVRIDAFAGAKVAAVAAALDKYLGGSVVIEADWISSSIVLSGAQTNARPGVNAVIRTVLLDKNTLQMEEKTFQAPEPGADDGAFSNFWNAVHAHLKAAKPTEKMLLLATERWPREPRYAPTPALRETLLKHGAHEATLNRWSALTRKALPCPIAGMSYVLAGDDGINHGMDALAAGFGDPDKTLRPRARVSVLLPRNPTTGLVRVLPDDKPAEDVNSELVLIQSHSGGGTMLSADPAGTTRVLLKAQDLKQPEQYWYLHSGPARYGMQPYTIVNYSTCGMLQGKRGGGESEIKTFDASMQDDVLWDIRGDAERANMLLLHYHHEAWNLTNVGASAAVRTWYQDGMLWRRLKRLPA